MAKVVEEVIAVKPLKIGVQKIRIVGDSPLIVHAYDAKSKRELLENGLNFPVTKAKEARNILQEFVSSMYWVDKMPETYDEDTVSQAIQQSRFGFPVEAIKAASLSASYRLGWSKNKVGMKGNFFIEPDFTEYYASDLEVDDVQKVINIVPNKILKRDLVQIKYDTLSMREDMVKIGGISKTPQQRFRAQFDGWFADLNVKYITNGQTSLDQIINIINAGGFVCGIGEWRPEKDGRFGMFHVEAAE